MFNSPSTAGDSSTTSDVVYAVVGNSEGELYAIFRTQLEAEGYSSLLPLTHVREYNLESGRWKTV